MNALGIIPARGGSKGLPGKNIRQLHGKPLIAWTIEAAKKSLLGKCLISTDSKDIAEVAVKYGGIVPFLRNANLATDNADSVDVVVDLLAQIELRPEFLVLLQPTSPLRSPADIDACLHKIVDSGANSCVTISPIKQPMQWCFYLEENSHLIPILEQSEKGARLLRRQDLPTTYVLNGAVYVVKTEYLLKHRKFISGDVVGHTMSNTSSIDIDTLEDFQFAEFCMQKTLGLNRA